ncbi:MAG: hypothetical protein NZ551_02805 [Microscillaceae bacterium]|nr:hypothetical protein [Microscillaceae bacterium]MDW8460117.1 hypothetical protein [Cytophagales bacterium]
MWIELIILLAVTSLTFGGLSLLRRDKKALPLTMENVLYVLRSTGIHATWAEKATEQAIEQYIAQKLARYFSPVHTQYKFVPGKYRRERIDIDLGEGKIGIEVKLAKLLKKSNERNRLLGQIDFYLQTHYTINTLLVVIVGQAHDWENKYLKEALSLLKRKRCKVFLLKTL